MGSGMALGRIVEQLCFGGLCSLVWTGQATPPKWVELGVTWVTVVGCEGSRGSSLHPAPVHLSPCLLINLTVGVQSGISFVLLPLGHVPLPRWGIITVAGA